MNSVLVYVGMGVMLTTLIVSYFFWKKVALEAFEVAGASVEIIETYRINTDRLYTQLTLSNNLIQANSVYMTAMELLLAQYISSKPPTPEMLEEYNSARESLIHAMTALTEDGA